MSFISTNCMIQPPCRAVVCNTKTAADSIFKDGESKQWAKGIRCASERTQRLCAHIAGVSIILFAPRPFKLRLVPRIADGGRIIRYCCKYVSLKNWRGANKLLTAQNRRFREHWHLGIQLPRDHLLFHLLSSIQGPQKLLLSSYQLSSRAVASIQT